MAPTLVYQYDFQTYVSDRSQCFKSHGIFDFTYKLKLHYNIYRLVFTIWTVKIIKIPLGSLKLYAKRNIPWEWAKWDLQNKRCAKYALEKRAHPNKHPVPGRYYTADMIDWDLGQRKD